MLVGMLVVASTAAFKHNQLASRGPPVVSQVYTYAVHTQSHMMTDATSLEMSLINGKPSARLDSSRVAGPGCCPLPPGPPLPAKDEVPWYM
jgi:hypothetical protein